MPASELCHDLFTSAVDEGELLVEVRVPKYTGWGARYEKFARVAQAWWPSPSPPRCGWRVG